MHRPSHSRDTSRMTVQRLPQVNANKGKGKHLREKQLFHTISRRSLARGGKGQCVVYHVEEEKLQSIEQVTLLTILSADQNIGKCRIGAVN